jgi:hypothetical protein
MFTVALQAADGTATINPTLEVAEREFDRYSAETIERALASAARTREVRNLNTIWKA